MVLPPNRTTKPNNSITEFTAMNVYEISVNFHFLVVVQSRIDFPSLKWMALTPNQTTKPNCSITDATVLKL